MFGKGVLLQRYKCNKLKFMNKRILYSLLVGVLILTGYQAAFSQNMKPAKSGYAPINGLQMYYEVYGKGKPIVLLHGSYMNIPLNWSQIIPLLAKDR